MSDPTTPAPPPAQPAAGPPPAKGRGCFFYGCITTIVILVVMGIVAFFVARYAINKFVGFAEQYTEAKPTTVPQAQMSSTEHQQLDKRVSAFADALRAQNAPAPLVLTGDEINALIANNPAWKGWKGKVFLAIEGDRIKGRVSIPIDELARFPGLSRLKGRYLNGSAAFKASLADGALFVTLQSVEANGQAPPPTIMAQLQSVNFAQNASNDPKTAETIGKLESIEVKDGAVIIKARVVSPK